VHDAAGQHLQLVKLADKLWEMDMVVNKQVARYKNIFEAYVQSRGTA
jgi:hypothetical protein